MKSEKLSIYLGKLKTLAPSRLLKSWELIALLLFMVTVLGIAARGPVNSFPELAASVMSESPGESALARSERDPYGVQPDRGVSNGVSLARGRVEMGL